MRKRIYVLLSVVLYIVCIGSVSAQLLDESQASAIDNTLSTGIIGELIDWGNIINYVIIAISAGIITIVAVIVLQYLGVDVIGLVFSFLFFIFDFFFSLLRFALASEGNLVAFVVMFILMWIIIMSM
jgi:hypothetical protein